MIFNNEQEKFWAGSFGSEYIKRNQSNELLASNLEFFSKILRNVDGINSCIEFGANIGMNLKALKLLKPTLDTYAIEINEAAAKELTAIVEPTNIYKTSILDFKPKMKWDLVVIKGVLIHVNPESLTQIYKKLVDCTNKYLLVAEYYNPSPISIPYRGHNDRLFKRDFAGEILDQYPHMALKEYGFSYHRDKNFPQDDITWFLIEKR